MTKLELFAYLHLDRLYQGVVGLILYRYEVTKCFFSAPRLGHLWEGNSLEAQCSRCPKHWIGNL